jgi:hypothetical protein
MRKRATALAMAIVLTYGISAAAREPFENEGLPFPPPVEPDPDPVAFVVPAGLYFVTDTYVADVVTTNDATTTYSTMTEHESTGTFARVIDSVDTGASSLFDGWAFNGRGALTDGRALAGTYYENFVLTADGYVAVSIVFFQDDSETKRRETASAPPSATPTPSSTASRALASGAPPNAATPSASTPAPSVKPQGPIAPASPTLRAGIALAADGPVLASAEVLRGRLIRFWPRAFANDVAVPIRSWRLLSAQPDYVSVASGGAEPLAAQWIQMTAPGVRLTLRFEVVPELAPNERLQAQISITLRSPALVD